MKLAIVTCTGDRPEAFELCQRWVARSDKTDLIWIVIGDGAEPEKFTRHTPDVYIQQKHQPGVNTLGDNFKLGMQLALLNNAEYIIVMEDDDYYSPDYITNIKTALANGAALVGIENVTYYNVAHKRYKSLENHTYSPLAATAFHTDLIPYMERAIETPEPYKTFDIKFWRLVKDLEYPIHMSPYPWNDRYVGIKGMPGRGGIGKGHRPDNNWKYDPVFRRLLHLIGSEDIKLYEPFLKKT